MPLPFNPMSFVTPYTAVGTASIGAGSNLANVFNAARNTKVQEGYLQNTQKREAFEEQQVGQKQIDQARERLDGALMSGNQDAVELAANNLRAVAQRYGFSLTETRSDAQLKSGVTTPVGKQEAEVGSAEKPFDVDAYDREQAAKASEVRQAQGKYTPSEEAEADKRIDAELAKTPNPFTGGVPGGSLPAMPPGKPQAAPLRTPGGSLPASPIAEPPGASEAPLRGYTLIGADGKPLYSVAPKDIEDRQRQRVGDVFDGLASKTQDQQELQWLAQAKAETEKLVGIMPLDEAVKEGLKMYMGQMSNRDKLAMVQANHKGGGMGGGAPVMQSGVVGGKEGQILGQLSDDELALIQHFKANSRFPAMEEADRGARAALNSLNSANPSSQFFAIRQLIQSM
ncbi:MAG TPA: hypothetical protein VIV12_12730, partial [Streptosporangiaceae bacterium]